MNNNEDKIKIVITGSVKTGKSILADFLKNGSVKINSYICTIGPEYEKKVLLYKNNLYNIEIWDLSGKPRFFLIAQCYMKGAHIFFVLFNYNDRNI